MSNSIENTRKRIDMFLNLYSQEQLDLIELLMETYCGGIVNKGDMMNLALSEEVRKKCDSALPFEQTKIIKEVLPSFNNGNYVYDYSKNSHGEMLNIFEALHIKLHTVLNSSNFDKITIPSKI